MKPMVLWILHFRIYIYIDIQILLKFTPPHKCHTTTVLYVYFGSRVKQLCCLLCIFSESGSGALAPVKGSLGK